MSRIDKFAFLAVFVIALMFCAAPCHAAGESDIQAANGVVERVTPKVKGLVSFSVDKQAEDSISIAKNGDGIMIKGSDARHLVAGYGWYLRHVAHAHFSWNGDRLNIPVPMPAPKETVTITPPWKVNFAFNYCTLSYTAAFWDWQRWQREIDFLALNGFTHVLVTAGLEKTWQLFLKDLGYPEKDVFKFIPNPAFAAWWNMGNLEGHGGPLTQRQIDQEALLGKQIYTRLRALNMVPVLQGYVGFLPSDFSRKVQLPGLKAIDQGGWVGFNRPWVLDPTCAVFPAVAEKWYKALHQVYGGKSPAYGGDLFHEGGRSGDINVTDAAKAVQEAMQKASPNSTWVVQAWGGNPSGALLKGLSKEHSLVLQLTKNMFNGGKALRTFDDKPWVWCELANFGGNTGMYGGLPLLSKLGTDLQSFEGKGVMGMGILSEGVETNPLHYELFFDRLWTKDDIALNDWLKEYAQRRYGSGNANIISALNKLATSIYSPVRDQEGCTESIICARPAWGVQKASTWSTAGMYYKLSDIIDAGRGFIKAAQQEPELMKLETFRYDLVDVMRQILADGAYYQLQIVKQAYDMKDVAAYKREVSLFLGMMSAMDKLLGCDRNFLLGTWTNRALAKGGTKAEKEAMDVASKMLITTWIAQDPQSLNDYSNRQWSGLVKDYYMPRWSMFFEAGLDVLEGKKNVGEANAKCAADISKHDLAFAKNGKVYPAAAQGNPLQVALEIMAMIQPRIKAWQAEAQGANGMPWSLSEGNKFSFDVTDQITAAGTFSATFKWQSGQSALEIHSVKLYEGETEVASDVHEGWTGQENRDNTYVLKLNKYRTGLDAYTLKADVSGASGNNSSGVLQFKKVK